VIFVVQNISRKNSFDEIKRNSSFTSSSMCDFISVFCLTLLCSANQFSNNARDNLPSSKVLPPHQSQNGPFDKFKSNASNPINDVMDITRATYHDALSLNMHRPRSMSLGSRRDSEANPDLNLESKLQVDQLSEETPLISSKFSVESLNTSVKYLVDDESNSHGDLDSETQAMLWYAASAEQNSDDVIGRAVVHYASLLPSMKPLLEPKNFVATTGRGLRCTINEQVSYLINFGITVRGDNYM
jgi:hypothetical protein